MQGPIAKGLGTAFYGPILAFTEQVNVRYWPISACRNWQKLASCSLAGIHARSL